MHLRQNQYLLMADIEKAFLRIKYLPEYTKFFKILYSKDLDDRPKVYKVMVTLFGLVSSPFILNRTLLYHLQRMMQEDPDVALLCVKLIEAFYLDDLGASFRSINEAKYFVHNSISI